MPDPELGRELTVWTARFAAIFYAVAVVLLVRKRSHASRIVSTLALFVYLAHVVCAFEYFYAWSHEVAYSETARQTEELFGVNWGGGVWLNYLFTLIWAADCAASWFCQGWNRLRTARLAAHAFLAFMVLNATVVVWILRAARNPQA